MPWMWQLRGWKAMDVAYFIDLHGGFSCLSNSCGYICKRPTKAIKEWMLILILVLWQTLCLRRSVCGVIVQYLCFRCFLCFVYVGCCHPLPYESMDLAHKPQSGRTSRGRSQLKGEECKEWIFLNMVFPHVRSVTAETRHRRCQCNSSWMWVIISEHVA